MEQQATHERKDSFTMGNHKYLNKFSQWLPDLKLKKTLSKRYRSQSLSLPMSSQSDDDSSASPAPHGRLLSSLRGHGRSKDYASDGPGRGGQMPPTKADRSFMQRKSFSLTGSMVADANGKKKKRSIASTMSNIMQKAKVYRRHSFSNTSLANDYRSDSSDNQRHARGAQPSTSRFIVSGKASHQSQSDPESVYSDFLSDTEDRLANDIHGDRPPDKDLTHAESLFATMDQTPKYQKTQDKSPRSPRMEHSDQGTAPAMATANGGEQHFGCSTAI